MVSLPYQALSVEDEYRLSELARNGDNNAAEKMLGAVLPLIKAAIGKKSLRKFPYEELLQEAMICVYTGISRYDPSVARWSTYAYRRAQGGIFNVVRKNHIVRVPEYFIWRRKKHSDQELADRALGIRSSAEYSDGWGGVSNEDPVRDACRNEAREIVMAAADTLEPRRREIFCRARLESVMIKDIAKDMGVSKTRVDQLLHDAERRVAIEILRNRK